jgi:hypothetical protein
MKKKQRTWGSDWSRLSIYTCATCGEPLMIGRRERHMPPGVQLHTGWCAVAFRWVNEVQGGHFDSAGQVPSKPNLLPWHERRP